MPTADELEAAAKAAAEREPSIPGPMPTGSATAALLTLHGWGFSSPECARTYAALLRAVEARHHGPLNDEELAALALHSKEERHG